MKGNLGFQNNLKIRTFPQQKSASCFRHDYGDGQLRFTCLEESWILCPSGRTPGLRKTLCSSARPGCAPAGRAPSRGVSRLPVPYDAHFLVRNLQPGSPQNTKICTECDALLDSRTYAIAMGKHTYGLSNQMLQT
jgi:hypothetical protein